MNGISIIIETGWPVPILWPNARPHHMKLASARKSARNEAFWATKSVIAPGWHYDGETRLKLIIEARPAVDRGRDDDGLIGACKAFRDGIAQALGIDDKYFDLQPVIWGSKHNHGGRLIFTVRE